MFIVIKDGISFIRFNIDEVELPYNYKGISIVKELSTYYFVLKKGFHFPDKEKKKKVEVKRYVIKHSDMFNDIEIYVYENDRGFHDYYIYDNVPFIIADNPKAPVIDLDPYLHGIYLYLKEGKIRSNYDCLLLNDRLYENEELKDGDKLSLLNFIFYYYEGFLYMNSFMCQNRLQRKKMTEEILKYEFARPELNTYFLPARKELAVPELKDFSPLRINRQRKIVFQIGPSITMSMAMLGIAAINVYNSIQNDQPLLNSLIYVLMPVTMLLSGVMWPLLSNHSEKKANIKEVTDNRKRYRDYLFGYEQKIMNAIDDYLKQENGYFFGGEINEGKLFYITDKSPSFLQLSIGLVIYKKGFEFKDPEDEDVNKDLHRIRYRLSNIENCPYFLDLKKYQRVSIYSYRSQRSFLMKKMLLELSSKYHYDDLYLAVYSEDLSIFSDFFGLPQLIFNNSRLTLNKKRELQELNSLKIDKPLVLLVYDKIDFLFTNKEIKVLYFTSDHNDIYKDSDVFIEYLDNEGCIYGKDKLPFRYENNETDLSKQAAILSTYQKVKSLDHVITFKDVFEGTDIRTLYQSKQIGLRADFATIGKEILSFDLHESKNGPHGLIGGSTGSGKSELIVSLLLSLCMRYRPDYLNIILIDYKGGGLEGSLSYKGKKVPHIIASIDNLEPDTFERLIVAIDTECKRRQKLFRELSDMVMTPIMNIDDYLDNEYLKHGLPVISHLLIVVDEFAELKKENPEVIRELISFSRIGRSLGLHLILATQRPSGIIDDEIWSNSRFKIALKVLSDKDSNDIIKSKDAAYLQDPGDFYLCFDDNQLKAKAIYSKRDINNADAYEVSLLDNRLDVIKKKTFRKKDPFTEAAFMVKKINEIVETLKIPRITMEFNRPVSLRREQLKMKYASDKGIILGETDDYLNASLSLLAMDENEDTFIYSGRQNEINGILNSLKKKTVVIGSKRYMNSCISDSLLYEEGEDIIYLFEKLLNDDVTLTLVIEDLSCLLSYSEDYSSFLYRLLRRSSITGLNIIALSKQSSVSFKLLNGFKNKYVIEISDTQDLINVFSSRCEYKGRSFLYKDKLICFIPCLEEDFIVEERVFEPYVEHVPDKICFLKDVHGILIGYGIKSRKPVHVRENEEILISSYDEERLDMFRKICSDYPNIKIVSYDRSVQKDDHDRYLWIGEGLFSQRFFYVDIKEDLKKNEAYYYKGNRGETIRIGDNE